LTSLDSILLIRTPPKQKNNSRLPPVSVSKLLRQKRLKNRGKSAGNIPSTLPTSVEGIQLSWNPIYNAAENYSFN
jgi:hypothetical protein